VGARQSKVIHVSWSSLALLVFCQLRLGCLLVLCRVVVGCLSGPSGAPGSCLGAVWAGSGSGAVPSCHCWQSPLRGRVSFPTSCVGCGLVRLSVCLRSGDAVFAQRIPICMVLGRAVLLVFVTAWCAHLVELSLVHGALFCGLFFFVVFVVVVITEL